MRLGRRRLWLLLVPLLALGTWSLWSVTIDAASLRVYQVPSKSMSPTIAPGDRIFVETRPADAPRRGEIWAFRMMNGKVWVKRVIGLPGESIEVAGGRVRGGGGGGGGWGGGGGGGRGAVPRRPDHLRDAAADAGARGVFRAGGQPEHQQRQPQLGPPPRRPLPRPGQVPPLAAVEDRRPSLRPRVPGDGTSRRRGGSDR